MTVVQAVFFDIGDTLVFDRPTLLERLTASAEIAGLPIDAARLPSAFREAERFAVRRYVDGIAWDEPGALRETVACLWSAMDLPTPTDSQWSVFAPSFATKPFTRHAHPESKPLLEELKQRGFMVGAISDWEDTLPDILLDLGLLSFFDALAISACVGVTKPNPLLFEDALAQVNLPSQNCLHIGDWFALDVDGAQAAGMQALLFDWAERSPDADCPRVTTWEQLTGYLRALPAPR